MAGLGEIDRSVEANNVPTSGGGSVTILPDDDYELEYIESDVKPNSKGTGKNFEGKIQVVSGPYKGTWFYGGINNINHQSAQSQSIAQGELKALCEATGVDFEAISDTDELHFRSFWASVRTETYFSKKHNKEMQKNVIAKYLYEGMPDDTPAPASPPAGKPAASSAPAAEPAKTATSGATGRRPWDKK